MKGIPPIISPELMKVLLEMGHGDELVLADGNFPAASLGPKIVRADGHGIPELLEAILKFFPLDTYADANIFLMAPSSGEIPGIWKRYEEILRSSGEPFKIAKLDRFQFYERAKKAYAIITTSEPTLYANVAVKKGVIIKEIANAMTCIS